ncbi:MAG TPA: LamG-like jellyroll fold domain-containing protein, partial [Gammaproteobacteria bacterium]|nr:LamG-like jellyroll fold domain-containing protein [Gammaproteobacteria bacterium]
KTGNKFLSIGTTIDVTVDAGALSGSSYVYSDTNNSIKFVSWPGRNNTPNGRAISILYRHKAGYSGSPTSRRSLLPSVCVNGRGPAIELSHETNGNVAVTLRNEAIALINNITTIAAWSPTSGTWYDIVLTWDGTNDANALKVYVDGTLLGQITPGGSFSAAWTNQYFTDIILGAAPINSSIIRGSTDEVIIWDSVIDPTSVTLNSGTGSLNGAARTSLVSVSSLDGSIYSNPGLTNVRNATGYTYAGVSITGTYLNTNPGASNVLNGIGYTLDSTSYTGSLVAPAPESTTPGTANLNYIIEQLRYVINVNNTTTASVDLSANLSTRVRQVMTVHPAMIRQQASHVPYVTCYVTAKDIEQREIAQNQASAKRKGTVKVEVAGCVWNDTFSTITSDPADQDINYLMENVEAVIRSYAPSTFGSTVKWTIPDGVEYYDQRISEQTHLRAGILKLNGTIFY